MVQRIGVGVRAREEHDGVVISQTEVCGIWRQYQRLVYAQVVDFSILATDAPEHKVPIVLPPKKHDFIVPLYFILPVQNVMFSRRS